jgi:hypothetical protein
MYHYMCKPAVHVKLHIYVRYETCTIFSGGGHTYFKNLLVLELLFSFIVTLEPYLPSLELCQAAYK